MYKEETEKRLFAIRKKEKERSGPAQDRRSKKEITLRSAAREKVPLFSKRGRVGSHLPRREKPY